MILSDNNTFPSTSVYTFNVTVKNYEIKTENKTEPSIVLPNIVIEEAKVEPIFGGLTAFISDVYNNGTVVARFS